MRLSKQEDNYIFPRCYDAASSTTPEYWLRIFTRETDITLEIKLTDSSPTPQAYQRFLISSWALAIAPGNYQYKIVDASDSNKVLERGRVTITDINHTTTAHEIEDTTTAHAVE